MDDLVLHKLQRPTQGNYSAFSVSADGNPPSQIGDDFPHDQAQFEIQRLIGDSHVQCVVIESNGAQIVDQLKFFEGICEREVASQLLELHFIPIPCLCILLKESFLTLQ
jgi:hypothetical protein